MKRARAVEKAVEKAVDIVAAKEPGGMDDPAFFVFRYFSGGTIKWNKEARSGVLGAPKCQRQRLVKIWCSTMFHLLFHLYLFI